MTELKTSVTTLPENKVELEVEVPAEEVKAQADKTVKGLSHEVKIPGFRKGKVPRNLIVQRYGMEAILAQTLEDAMPVWLGRAIESASLKPVDQPELDIGKLEAEDKPFSFKATLAVMPKPDVGKYTGIEVEKDIVDVDDADVDEQIDRLRTRLASLQAIEGRPSQEGDHVLIDFTGYVEGEPLEGGSGRDYMLELGSKQFIPGFEDQIAGMEMGQSKKLKLTFPDDYRPEELSGKDAEFDVTVKEIKERVLPKVDDEFAAENSEFDTINELRDELHARLQKAREEEAEAVFRQRAVEQVVSEAKLVVPPKAVDVRARELELDFVSSLEAQGVGADQYLKMPDEEKEKFSEHFRSQAEAALKREAVLEKVAEIEKIEVADEEVDDEIRQAAPRMHKEPDELVAEMREKGRVGVVRDDLLYRKAAAHIAEHAIPVLKKAGPAPEEEQEPESKIITP
jgi:trigger factor